jgi:hypothetical protein
MTTAESHEPEVRTSVGAVRDKILKTLGLDLPREGLLCTQTRACVESQGHLSVPTMR